MKALYLTFLIGFSFLSAHAQCNGYSELCDKRFDEVCIVMTHNAYNAEEEGFTLGNQTYGLERQLMDGVRGFMLDIYDDGTEIVVYHSFEFLGKRPLQDELGFIRNFLDNNPTEILSIIFETNVTSTQLENELVVAGLMPYLHEQTLGAAWPTLQEMIDDNKRLVIFSESDNGLAAQAWYHYAWDYTFDTDYSYSDPSEFSCSVNRGSVTNDLYLVNHWITTAVGTGDINQAMVVNANPLLIDRLQECEMENNRFPNFIGIDFHHVGDAFEAAEIMNGITTSVEQPIYKSNLVHLYAQGGQLIVEPAENLQLRLFSATGQSILMDAVQETKEIPVSHLPSGVYYYQVLTENRKYKQSGAVQIVN